MATIRFQLFRLSLLLHEQMSLFDHEVISREEYLRGVFSQEYQFDHYRNRFHYRPDLERSTGNITLGRVGRPMIIEENRPPEEGLGETTHEGWKAAVVVIHPSDHPDGQKASVEIDQQVGKPTVIFAALVNAINQANPSPYQLEVQPIIDARSFWEFASANQGAITSLTFEFTVPNGLWSTATHLREELIEAREHIKAHKVTAKFQSDDGLETNDERIVEAVNYAASGSGIIKARARNKKRSILHLPQRLYLSQ